MALPGVSATSPSGSCWPRAALRRLTESHGPRPQLDLRGLALAAGGALGITWALVRASTAGWTSAEVLATMLGGAVLTATFIVWQLCASHPMIPPALFRSLPAVLRSFSRPSQSSSVCVR